MHLRYFLVLLAINLNILGMITQKAMSQVFILERQILNKILRLLVSCIVIFEVNTKDLKIQKNNVYVKQYRGTGALFGNIAVNTVGSFASSVSATQRFEKKNGTRIGGSVSNSKNQQKDKMLSTRIKFK